MSKTKPIGVRFDEEKLELIKKEQNLVTYQEVLNFLMDNYGKHNNVVKEISKTKEKQIIVELEKQNTINLDKIKPPKNKGESSLEYQIRLKELGF